MKFVTVLLVCSFQINFLKAYPESLIHPIQQPLVPNYSKTFEFLNMNYGQRRGAERTYFGLNKEQTGILHVNQGPDNSNKVPFLPKVYRKVPSDNVFYSSTTMPNTSLNPEGNQIQLRNRGLP